MKFSIVVPVFNSERYLEECLNSVLGQTYKNFELILVDDGSTDNSGVICDRYAQNDNRVRVFHEINSGVSLARNKGLENITGEWLLFLDSDDILHQNTLESLSKYIKNTPQVDVFQFGFSKHPFLDSSVLKEDKCISALPPHKYCEVGIYNVSVWGSAIRVKLINENHLKFDCNLKLAEDQVFIFQVFQKAALCSRLPDVLYYYRDTPFSATKTAKFEYMLQTIRSLEYYKLNTPLAVEQFDNVILSFIYYMILDQRIPKNVIVDLFHEVNVNYAHRCTRGVRLMFYLSKISMKFAITVIRTLKNIR